MPDVFSKRHLPGWTHNDFGKNILNRLKGN